jgi:hypothetical protein
VVERAEFACQFIAGPGHRLGGFVQRRR